MNYNDIKPGQLISAYHKGFHRVISKELTDGGTCELVHYEQVITSNFTIPKYKAKYCCNVAFCTLITQEVIEAMKTKYLNGLKVLEKELRKDTV